MPVAPRVHTKGWPQKAGERTMSPFALQAGRQAIPTTYFFLAGRLRGLPRPTEGELLPAPLSSTPGSSDVANEALLWWISLHGMALRPANHVESAARG